MEIARLFAALPSYDGRRVNGRALSDLLQIRNLEVRTYEVQGSLLAANFNRAWAQALNWQSDFFLMLHDDIVPLQDEWIQIMFAELTQHKASVLSVVSPIKNPDGLTSTAVEAADLWHPRRLAMTEVMQKPETWTEPGLLLNDGLMLVDFRQPWVHEAYFTINDRIVRRPDGQYEHEVEPEDWFFSRRAQAAGAKLFATRKVLIQHIGSAGYDNTCAWGEHATDPEHAQEAK
jgi:hypothetical protein